MSKGRERSVSRQRAGAAPEQATVVIRIDQRVLVGALVVLALGVALLTGIMVGGQVGGGRAPVAANPVSAPVAPANPAGVQVVPGVSTDGQGTVIQLGPEGQVQSASPGLVVATRQPSASGLDPNLENFALADPNAPIGNVPRLTVSDLDRELSYDFGVIQGNQPVERTFTVKNTGKANLLIGQVFASCGCTIPRFANAQMNEEGLIIPPIELAPGATAELVVRYDPTSRPDDVGLIKKYIQIFSNDPKGKPVGDDPSGQSRELRFRITGTVVR